MGVSSENVEPADEAEVEGHGLSSGLTSGHSSANDEPEDEGEVEGHALSS